jgi:hypothetical protein
MKQVQLPSGLMLMFREEEHVYRIGTDWNTAENAPGTHEVMERYGIIEPMNEWARPWVERGQRVHLATEQYDLGEFDPDCAWAKSPEGKYIEGYAAFQKAHPEFAKPEGVEQLVGSEPYWMATLADRTFDAFRLLQLKTGQPAKYHPVQLALEGFLAFPSAAHFDRYAVYLADDGSFKLKLYGDDESLDVARQILKTRQTVRKFSATRRKPTKAITESATK